MQTDAAILEHAYEGGLAGDIKNISYTVQNQQCKQIMSMSTH